MNDRQDPYGQIYGYDEYGRPLYHPTPPQPGYGHDPYAAQAPAEPQPYDPYAAGAPPDVHGVYPPNPAPYGAPDGTGGYPVGQHGQHGPPAHQTPYGDAPEAYAPDGYAPDGYAQDGYASYQQTAYGDLYAAPSPETAPYPGPGGAPAPEGHYPWGGHDPYGTGPQPAVPPGPAGQPGGHPQPGEHGYPSGPGGHDPHGGWDPHGTGPQPAVPEADGYRHGAAAAPGHGAAAPTTSATGTTPTGVPATVEARSPQGASRPPEYGTADAAVPAPRDAVEDGPDYRTEQFAFVEEDNTDSEEVIDWLKFTESRTERREESKRRATGRRRLLVVLLVLSVIGACGYLYVSDRLPFLSNSADEEAAAEGAESRDVIVLHLRETGGDTASTALLVANETTGEATTLLLPNAMVVAPDGGTTTLGQAVQDEGAASVRNAVGTLLGADIKGTWRLDTPYLENLVDLAGGVTVEADTEVPGEDDEPLVTAGEQRMDGRTAVAYALYRADEEPEEAQLERFGAVLSAALDELPQTEDGAHQVVENLAQIADPSLSENDLGVSLAQLAEMAQDGSHTTTLLPVEEDGSISDEVAEDLVADVLGGTVTEADMDGTPRVALHDASGSETAGESARIGLVNGGYTVVDNRETDPTETSEVRYEAEPFVETAREVARTLGIPEDNVVEGGTPGSADVAVVLGADFEE